ncbi:MAG: substrate-binding domain-containing protein, partial [Victivallales bacterium]|nr:substrate-binding domain-containing protein [Victivallales bacterium]
IGLLTFTHYQDPQQNAFWHHKGYIETMRQAGLETAVYPLDNTERIDSVYQDSKQILASAYAPTALIAASNSLAYGAILYFRDHGVKVPEDISLIGCANDCYMAERIIPRLTYFPITFKDMSEAAIQKCLNLSPVLMPDSIYIKQTIQEGVSVRDLSVKE